MLTSADGLNAFKGVKHSIAAVKGSFVTKLLFSLIFVDATGAIGSTYTTVEFNMDLTCLNYLYLMLLIASCLINLITQILTSTCVSFAPELRSKARSFTIIRVY